jgi:hypothetical protein
MGGMCGLLSIAAGKHSQLRRGDVVELRPPAEIVATLDETGALEGVPFMPEMLNYFGGRFRVTARVERACDTITWTGARRMPETVLLDDLRCDGSAHGGCEAGCRLYWKEAWLRRATGDAPERRDSPDDALPALQERVRRNTRVMRGENGRQAQVYRCQATEFLRATDPLGWYDPKSFIRELTCGNVGIWRWLRVTMRAVLYAVGTKLGLALTGPVHPRPQDVVTAAELDLKSGDLIQVKSKAEIEETLDAASKTRGLWFDREMLPYCGERHTVQRPVQRFIDERSGEMVELKTDAIILDGVVCHGYDSVNRWFCPRAIYPWWRECWLERVEDQSSEQT